ncbi:MAG: Secretion system C-terminal sorting domain [Bacteroidota bacterium]|jgi:hypothetical protein
MKKYLLLILLSTFIMFAKAQYHPMLSDSTKWNIYHEIVDGGFTINYSIKSDTIINTISYKKLFSNAPGYNNIIGQNGFGYILAREDSMNKKILLRFYDTTIKEMPIYDFSLQYKGDSIFLPFIKYSTVEYKKYFLDSIYQYNSKVGQRKVLLLKKSYKELYYPEALTWVEGIGNVSTSNYKWDKSPFYFLYYTSDWNMVTICNHKNEIHQYQNLISAKVLATDSCYAVPWAGIEDVKIQSHVSIFPNPTSSSFNIKKITNGILQFNLYNLIGQKLIHIDLKNESTLINTHQLPPNVYLFSITNIDNRIIQSGKIIIE